MKLGRDFIIVLILLYISGGCNLPNHPTIELPDGDKDRMEKKDFSGTKEEPKYWFSKVTVVNTSFGIDTVGFVFEGLQSPFKVGYFEFTQDKLEFKNAVTRQSLEEPEVASQGLPELINSWDIQHSATRLQDGLDGELVLREEENRYISWKEKSHFIVDWSKADISEASIFPGNLVAYSEKPSCWQKKASKRMGKEILEDYISFVVRVEYERKVKCSNKRQQSQKDFVTTVDYKYSFKKAKDPRLPDENYKPYVYKGEQDPLLRKYGFFRTVRPAISDVNWDKNIFFMNRWNPNKRHTFYFTRDYPEEYKDIAYGIICHTNRVFAEHGLNNYPSDGKCTEDGSVLPGEGERCTKGICFELRENTGQKLGDIRYSFFHFLKVNIPLAGYGPSDAHPATGEIVGGNVIVASYFIDFLIKYGLEKYLKRDSKEYYNEKGERAEHKTKYENSSLFVKMKEVLGEQHALWTHTSKNIDRKSDIRLDFQYLLSKLTFGHPVLSRFTAAGAKVYGLNFDKDRFSEINIDSLHDQLESKIEEIQKVVHQSNTSMDYEKNVTIYPAEPIIAQIPSMLANGMSLEEVKRRILFYLMIHEFGHVLGLRHNFYGSVDSKHWHKDESNRSSLKSSSVMDYLNLKDEARGPLRAVFGLYDEAALVYAYSMGNLLYPYPEKNKDLSKERDTHYLFCTDHHRPSNFLCNAFDTGDTASKVMMSLIENYEEAYLLNNLRLDRAYWNTKYYPIVTFNAMWDMKRALLMLTTAFTGTNISTILTKSGKNYQQGEIENISTRIQDDIIQAIRLSLAFYHSVIQTSEVDRDWKDSFDPESGSIERIGIAFDKLAALLFLMGDEGFVYNPNVYFPKASYLTYMDTLGRDMIENIIESTLTFRIDMETWFIDLARILYTLNISNPYNLHKHGDSIDEPGILMDRIAVRCYTPKGLKDHLGIDPYADSEKPLTTAVIPVREISDHRYNGNKSLGITEYDGDYYVTGDIRNRYSFAIIRNILNAHARNQNVGLFKKDLYDVFYLYNMAKRNGNIPECYNGD